MHRELSELIQAQIEIANAEGECFDGDLRFAVVGGNLEYYSDSGVVQSGISKPGSIQRRKFDADIGIISQLGCQSITATIKFEEREPSGNLVVKRGFTHMVIR